MTKETQDKPVLASAIWRPVRASNLEILDARGRRIALCTYPDECAAMVESINQLPAIKAENEALRKALKNLVEYYVSNIGTDWEFISCVTPSHASDMTPKERKKCPCWSRWDAARSALALTGGRDTKSS